jgi:selenocysteine lyase/cysteine desulfurase
MQDVEAALAAKPRIMALNYASNLLGTINPVKEIVKMAHAAGTLVYVDAVQYTPHGAVDVQDLDCDFLACSAYKFFGPHISVLYGKYDLLEKLPAYKVRPAPVLPPNKFETGTGCFENVSGLLGVMEYFEWLGKNYGSEYEQELSGKYSGRRLVYKQAMSAIRDYEYELDRRLIKVLQGIPNIHIYGITDLNRLDERVPTFSFTLPETTPLEAAEKLGSQGIFVWDGNNYALAITDRLGLEDKGGVIRVGASHYHTLQEVDRLEEALRKL